MAIDEAQAATQQQDNPGQQQETTPDGGGEQQLILGKFKDVDALKESYTALEKKLGQRPAGLVHPGEKATPEQLQAFNAEVRKLSGVPDAPDGYGIDAPEGLNPEAWSGFLAEAHGAGLTKEQIGWLQERAQAQEAAIEQARKDHVEEVAAELKKEWGEKGLAQRLNLGERVLSHLDTMAGLNGGLVKELEGSNWTGSKAVIMALAKLGDVFGEETLKGGKPEQPAGKISMSDMRARLNDPRYRDPSQRDPEFVKETDALWDKHFEGQEHTGGQVRV